MRFQQWHINRLELRAVQLALAKFESHVSGRSVLVRSDNTTTCAYINKQGATHSPELCTQAWELWMWCIERQIQIRAIYIPGLVNDLADSLSRDTEVTGTKDSPIDQREWSLHQEVA